MSQNPQHHLENLREIRNLMERSSRFSSLNGLSGVFAGIFALIGAALVYWYIGIFPFEKAQMDYTYLRQLKKWGLNFYEFVSLDGITIFLLASGSAIFFTVRKAKKENRSVWDITTKRMLINLFIPLIAGGILCLAMIYHQTPEFVASTTLIFYGLGLVNAGKYTLKEIYYLGLSEVILGLIASFLLAYSLEFWALGFGILHIVYGIFIFLRYE